MTVMEGSGGCPDWLTHVADDKNFIIRHHSHRHHGLHIQTPETERGTLPCAETSQTFPHNQETTQARPSAAISRYKTEEEEETTETGKKKKFRIPSDESSAGYRAEGGQTANTSVLQQLL